MPMVRVSNGGTTDVFSAFSALYKVNGGYPYNQYLFDVAKLRSMGIKKVIPTYTSATGNFYYTFDNVTDYACPSGTNIDITSTTNTTLYIAKAVGQTSGVNYTISFSFE